MKRLFLFITLLFPLFLCAQTQYGRIQTDGIANKQTIAITGATPSVAVGNVFVTANVSNTTITNFIGGVDSQEITIICGEAHTTIANNITIVTATAANITCASNVTNSFVYYAASGQWIQQSGGNGSTGSAGGDLTGAYPNPTLAKIASVPFCTGFSPTSGQMLQYTTGSSPNPCYTAATPTASAGGSPVQGQFNNSGALAGSSCANLPSIGGTTINFDCDAHFKGMNPWFDITRFGASACDDRNTPCASGITANTTSGNPVVPVSTSSCPGQAFGVCFVNGNGVTIAHAGAAHTMTTPTAPTVTPSVANILTGTKTVSPGPAGSTTYSYQVFAENTAGGITAASTATTITTGAAGLGFSRSNLVGCTRNGVAVTCTTTAPHIYALSTNPQLVHIQSTSDPSFVGWFTIINVPDSTHFTFYSSENTGTGASTSTTGGVADGWNCNHVTWSPVTGAYRYWIVGRTPGSMTTIGVSWPENAYGSLITGGHPMTQGVYSWDDFGGVMGGLTLPFWIPSAPPALAANNNLTTTITSGAGTTSLTLATAPSASVSGANVWLDSAPAIIAAQAAAQQVTNGASVPIYVPSTSNNAVLSFPVSSYIDFTGSGGHAPFVEILVSGTLQLNNTLAVNGYAKIAGVQVPVTGTSFAYTSLPYLIVGAAYPGIHNVAASGFNIEGVSINSANSVTNNALLVVQDYGGANPGPQYVMDELNVQGEMDIAILGRGYPGGLSSNITLDRVVINAGGAGAAATPVVLCADCGSLINKSAHFSHRGMYMGPDPAGFTLRSDDLYFQAAFAPALGFGYPVETSIGAGNIQIYFNGQNTLDTTGSPLIWFGPGSNAASVFLDKAGGSALGGTIMTGVHPSMTWGKGVPNYLQPTGSTMDMMGPTSGCTIDGLFNTTNTGCTSNMASFYSGGQVISGPAYSMFVDQLPMAAPTLSLAAGTGLTVGPHTFQIAPIWLNGGQGLPSTASTITTTSGNQNVNVSWTPIPGGCIGYQLYRDGSPAGGNVGSCAASSILDNGIAGGATPPSIPGGGATMLMPGRQGIASGGPVYAPSLNLFNANSNSVTVNTVPFAANRTATFPDVTGYIPVTSYQNSVYDNFNRANGALGGPNYTSIYGFPAITGNQMVATGLVDAIWIANSFSATQFSQFTHTALTGWSGAYVRSQAPSPGAYVCMEFSNEYEIGIQTNVGAINALVTNNAVTGFVGDVVRCEVSGSTITMFVNRVQVLQTTDTTWTSGKPGFGSNNAGEAIDNWSGGNLHPIAQLDMEQDWTQPQHIATALTLGATNPIAGALTNGSLTVGAFTDYLGSSAPANPPTGYCREYFNSGTGQMSYLNSAGLTCAPNGISNTTITIGTTAIAANTCTAANTATMTGVLTTTVFAFSPNADISTVTGWGSTGGLVLTGWPTANTLNYRVCNQTGSSITPSASVTFNVSAK